MNEDIRLFVEELKSNPNVLGILLMGSWARGNNRPNSDTDLLVIQTEGFKKSIEQRNQQLFEIIYTTKDQAIKFWKENKDDCAELWEIAKILYDKNDLMKELEEEAREIIKESKPVSDKQQIEILRFDAEDQIRASASLIETDITSANFLLNNKLFTLTETFFDLRGLWTPSPKQRLAKIKELNPRLYLEIEKFYQDGAQIKDKVKIAEEITKLVFEI